MKNIKKEFNSIFDFDNDEEKIDFEERALNSEVMNLVTELMAKNNIKTKADLALKLGVKSPHVTKLFTGDKKFNVNTLVKLQRIFNTRFKIVDKLASHNTTHVIVQITQKSTVSKESNTLSSVDNSNVSREVVLLN
ncbi:MAG TPA: helix-turn-helix transcriptional regulator [Bacteroidia bacterium]|nr:helix-turn-helix transcriptional regulator [Bacteroidia bacterium]